MPKLVAKPRAPDALPVVVAVDDDVSNLDHLARVMRDDCDLYTASSGVEALEVIEGLARLDALVVDHRMSKMNGAELLGIINETYEDADDVIKVLLAARTDVESAVGTTRQNLGRVDCYLPKPVSPTDIQTTVSYLLSLKSKERRRSSRVLSAFLRETRLKENGRERDGIQDLSEHGMFLTTNEHLPLGTLLPLQITIPGGRHINLRGRVTRIDANRGGVGIDFGEPDENDGKNLKLLVRESFGLGSLKRVRELFPGIDTDGLVRFDEKATIEQLLQQVCKDSLPLSVCLPYQRTPTLCRMEELVPGQGEVRVAGDDLHTQLRTSEPIFASFHLANKTYSFETMVARIDASGNSATLVAPQVLFYSEKRRLARPRRATQGRRVAFDPPQGGAPVEFDVIERTEHGLSFACPDRYLFFPGTPIGPVKLVHGLAVEVEEHGEIRHVSKLSGSPGFLRVGIEFGMGRRTVMRLEDSGTPMPTTAAVLAQKKPEQAESQKATRPNWLEMPIEVVRFESAPGEEIVALLNQAGPSDGPTSVIVLPPSYGKKKETLVGLAMTICETFANAGQRVAVLRYDGARRRGESFHEPGLEAKHNQMVHATLSQGARDIEAALAFARNNPYFSADTIGLVTFSLSAVEARLLLRDPEWRNLVDAWVVAMGVADMPEVLVRAAGGVDRVENHKMGIEMGVVPMFGQRVDADHFLRDAFAQKLIDISDAKRDFGSLDLPITWIYGAYDAWVDSDGVNGLMSVDAGAPREVVEVPLGHIARSSDEAIQMFGRVAQQLLRRMRRVVRSPKFPEPQEFLFVNQAERDRLPDPRPPSLTEYWRSYLLGDERSLGFDVMWYSDAYQSLLQTQLDMLDVSGGQVVADLGAGTGNFSRYLIEKSDAAPERLFVADLVEGALVKAEAKLRAAMEATGVHTTLEMHTEDLEINRYEPVRDFLAGHYHSIDALAGRIPGMGVQAVRELGNGYCGELHQLLRGGSMDAATDEWLKSRFGLEACRLVSDLNTAARVVRGECDAAKTTYRALTLPDDAQRNRTLSFGDAVFDRIACSLVLSYIREPLRTLREMHRCMAPGGVLVVSSMLPDADFSTAFRAIIEKVESAPPELLPDGWSRKQALESARQLLHDASSLADLEEEGAFQFFSAEQLQELLSEAGFADIEAKQSFGDPPQAIVLRARKKA